MDKDVTGEITGVIDTLRRAEAQARLMLQTAREQRLSFGLSYNHIDDDIAQTLGRLRYMLQVAERARDKRPVETIRYDTQVNGAPDRPAAMRDQSPRRSGREDHNLN